eukprot:gene16494-biopygen13147
MQKRPNGEHPREVTENSRKFPQDRSLFRGRTFSQNVPTLPGRPPRGAPVGGAAPVSVWDPRALWAEEPRRAPRRRGGDGERARGRRDPRRIRRRIPAGAGWLVGWGGAAEAGAGGRREKLGRLRHSIPEASNELGKSTSNGTRPVFPGSARTRMAEAVPSMQCYKYWPLFCVMPGQPSRVELQRDPDIRRPAWTEPGWEIAGRSGRLWGKLGRIPASARNSHRRNLWELAEVQGKPGRSAAELALEPVSLIRDRSPYDASPRAGKKGRVPATRAKCCWRRAGGKAVR